MEIFNEYIAMWKNYVNFNDRTNVRGYWMAWLWNFVASLVLVLLARLLNTTALSSLYALAALIPGLAISVRRLRDSGKQWTYLLFALIPIAGAIILIIQLCKPSIPDDGTPVV